MKHTVLVTGAAGYIGSMLVPALLRAGHQVRAVDRFFFGEDRLAPHPQLSCFREDTRHLPEDLVHGCDAVIDLAAVSNDAAGAFFPHSTWSINHWARVRTARLARDAGVRHYLLPSSCSVYGSSDAVCDESSPVTPLSHYARANLLTEQDILPLASPSFRVSVLRLATVFGNSPRLRLDLAVNAFTHDAWHSGAMALMRDGRQQRPFVHVADVAEAFCHFLDNTDAGNPGRLFNIGASDQNMTLEELARLVRERVRMITGRQVQQRWYGSPDPRSYRVDFSRVRDAAGWQPKRTLTDGIDELFAGFDAGHITAQTHCDTLRWYQTLESSPQDYTHLSLHGGLLVLPGDEQRSGSNANQEPEARHAC